MFHATTRIYLKYLVCTYRDCLKYSTSFYVFTQTEYVIKFIKQEVAYKILRDKVGH